MSGRHLGLDLGGTNIKVAVLEADDAGFRVVFSDKRKTRASGGPEQVTRNLIDAALDVIEAGGDVSTIGLGVPGLFERDTGKVVLFPNLPGEWSGFPIRDRMEEAVARSI